MKWLRADGAAIARALLLAFALQLAAPLLDTGIAAAGAGQAALNADLQASLCHSPDGSAPDAAPATGQSARHCVFCLPLAGDAAARAEAPPLPLPMRMAPAVHSIAGHQRPAAKGAAFASSRAPPLPSRTA